MEEAPASLQAPVFEWDGDEERFAMEKVHGVNDFDNDDQAKFSTMDEVNGDDDWRALAASQPQPEQPVVEEVAAMETSSTPPPQDVNNAQKAEGLLPSAAAASAAATTPLHTQVADIRIMRFTRKRTPNQRMRRKSVLVKPSELLEKFPILKDLQQHEQQEQKGKEVVSAKGKVLPEGAAKKMDAGSKQQSLESKSLLGKQTADDTDKDAKSQRPLPGKQADGEKRGIRPKQQQAKADEQQQNKKQKSLAFQKSRNMVNKKISAESVKAEPGLDLDCLQVAAMQTKQKVVASEFKALRDEISSLVSGEEEAGLKEVPSALQERWIDLHCQCKTPL